MHENDPKANNLNEPTKRTYRLHDEEQPGMLCLGMFTQAQHVVAGQNTHYRCVRLRSTWWARCRARRQWAPRSQPRSRSSASTWSASPPTNVWSAWWAASHRPSVPSSERAETRPTGPAAPWSPPAQFRAGSPGNNDELSRHNNILNFSSDVMHSQVRRTPVEVSCRLRRTADLRCPLVLNHLQ